ncbi:FadR family transcriptional regulator [Dactylosporangium aurantiacum]|uniref:FadR family transcriptional regulator n=1 Tax=Dactylosporangium aurantiacum TaxID=35754 RepID=A0A9Q9MJ89_9ACTN|nr:FCD domain-containing protein [Dactylosporangium aurantiacum]MDG6107657.1 FCD domain-containing protein [Dactylosporangium aurantiacum]UWZ58749.1 FadR family transcriptional regulator [Dactylosporangium aurantiacum]
MVDYGRGGAHGRLVAALGAAIVNGELAPDADLDPIALEKHFGVSRTVVREGLRVLAAKGLVGARPRRGTFVAPREQWALLDSDVLRWRFADGVDATFLDELGEVRLTVEPAAARLAALRRTDRDLADLEDALAAMRAAAGHRAAQHVEADLAFHDALLRATHNELLLQMSATIEVGLRLRDQFVHDVLTTESADKHAEVLLAVRRQRPKAAETAMRELIESSIDDVEAAKAVGSAVTAPAGIG